MTISEELLHNNNRPDPTPDPPRESGPAPASLGFPGHCAPAIGEVIELPEVGGLYHR